jgi:hypothetical protein
MNNPEYNQPIEPGSERNTSEIPEEPKTSRTEKGEVFQNYNDFYTTYSDAGIRPTVRIHNMRIEGGTLVDAPGSCIDAVPHRITENYANMNAYISGKLEATFRLTQDTISNFQIEIIKK